MLVELQSLLEHWSEPVHRALLRRQYGEASAALERARGEAEQHDSGGGGVGAYLRLLELQLQERIRPHEFSNLLLLALDDLSSTPPDNEVSAALRARVLFQLACMADLSGLRELSTEAGDAWLDAVPSELRDNAVFAMLSYWAFRHMLPDQMFAAYTEFLVHRKASLSRYSWERLRLMNLLVTGQAIFRDVEATIDKLPHKHQADHFASEIRPRLDELGLWDEKLELRYVLKVVDLDESEHEPIPPDPEHYAWPPTQNA